ncbi:tyrosine-type recombinase/integrase [Kordiimonas sp.]|uniref:tyrosine-type recombinase/integrase n=1 Tax=Kordiimonas sp. TaxID=1970157 RepID=UPI003A91DBE7
MFIILMIATAARPDAIRELTRGQCDVKSRLIKLNPNERAQTKKYRPTLRMPESIVPVIKRFDADAPEVYLVGGSDEMLKSVRTTWLTARKNAKLDDQVNPYSLRHTMARWLRKSGVPAWEVSAQLGHKRQDLSITEVYAPYDPGYLGEATKAIDTFFAELRANSVLVDEMLGELSA